MSYVLLILIYSKSNYAKSLLLSLGITQELRRKQNTAQILAFLLCKFGLKAGSTDNISAVCNVFEEQFLQHLDVNYLC